MAGPAYLEPIRNRLQKPIEGERPVLAFFSANGILKTAQRGSGQNRLTVNLAIHYS
jgi:hypothetical protein